MKSKLPIREVGCYTIQWYDESGDCVERQAWNESKGGLLEAKKYALDRMEQMGSTSCSVDRRVYTSLVTKWTPKGDNHE